MLYHLRIWTKIQPFSHDFIEAASKICELYVYTMGERAYAVAMVRLLGPIGHFLRDRIIS
jgi:RNA polymerase II C-terminal domain phosphatase-like 3/4